jgi:hypothetical protein
MNTPSRISFQLSTTTPDKDCFLLLRELYGLGYKVLDFTLIKSSVQNLLSLSVGQQETPTLYAKLAVKQLTWFYRPSACLNWLHRQMGEQPAWISQSILRRGKHRKPLQPYETIVPSEHMQFIRLRQAKLSMLEAGKVIAWRAYIDTIHHIHVRTYSEWKLSAKGTL